MIDLVEARRVLAAMTPGDWSVHQDGTPEHRNVSWRVDAPDLNPEPGVEPEDAWLLVCETNGARTDRRANALGIAYFKNQAAAMLDEIEQLRLACSNAEDDGNFPP
jgi:hypothetical protein